MASENRVPDPTPHEIAERAAKVRQGWTQEERLRRIRECGSESETPTHPTTEDEPNAGSSTASH